jgi:hypothetical protein
MTWHLCGHIKQGQLPAIARGSYVAHRVFFLTEGHARAAGYRPCGVCLPAAYASWKAQQGTEPGVTGHWSVKILIVHVTW